eukprot:UN05373
MDSIICRKKTAQSEHELNFLHSEYSKKTPIFFFASFKKEMR